MSEDSELHDSGARRLLNKMSSQEARQRWVPAIAVMVTVVVSVIGASYNVGVRLGAMDQRIQTLEDFMSQGGRFTQKDGDRLEDRIDKNETRLDSLPSEVPPKWVKQQLEESRECQRRTRDKLTQLQQQVTDIQSLIEHSLDLIPPRGWRKGYIPPGNEQQLPNLYKSPSQ